MMLRELHEVLGEVHASIAPMAQAQCLGVRLSSFEFALPMDMVALLRDGGCVLLADVPRSSEAAHWSESSSQLRVRWIAQQEEEVTP
jgi:hypothetical protein